MGIALTLGLACDAVGGAEIVIDRVVEYAKGRVQFGRPIGSFQAIKHRLANLYVLLQGMTAITESAVRHHADPPLSDAASTADPMQVEESAAHAYSADAYARIAGDAILVYGAIGFTWEHDVHRYLKRAILNQHLAGPLRVHRNRHLEARLSALGVPC
jgi:alkylation response protein AidB-like acyl-CoA dehydrogenase